MTHESTPAARAARNAGAAERAAGTWSENTRNHGPEQHDAGVHWIQVSAPTGFQVGRGGRGAGGSGCLQAAWAPSVQRARALGLEGCRLSRHLIRGHAPSWCGVARRSSLSWTSSTRGGREGCLAPQPLTDRALWCRSSGSPSDRRRFAGSRSAVQLRSEAPFPPSCRALVVRSMTPPRAQGAFVRGPSGPQAASVS